MYSCCFFLASFEYLYSPKKLIFSETCITWELFSSLPNGLYQTFEQLRYCKQFCINFLPPDSSQIQNTLGAEKK